MGCTLNDLGPAPAAFAEDVGAWLTANAGVLGAHRYHDPDSMEDDIERGCALQRRLWDAGWARWGWPEHCGGLGGSALLRGTLYETLTARGYVVPETMATIEVMGPIVAEHAPQVAREYLPRYLSGNELWCQGFSEPDAGSDLAALRTRAIDEGAHFRVNGQKVWSSLGGSASRCLAVVRTGDPDSGHRGLSMLLVDVDTPGVTVVPTRAMTGRNEFAEVFFDDAVVSRDRLIGEVGQGWTMAMLMLQWERGMYAWQRQAHLHRRLDDLVGLLHADAHPCASHAEQAAGAYLLLYALRMKCRRTLRLLAAGENPGPDISIDKILLADAEQAVYDTARAVLEDELLVGDDDRAREWRGDYFYSRAASIYGGTAEIQRNIVADHVLGLPREVTGGR